MNVKPKSNNKELALAVIALMASMVLLSFAAAPIYTLFCKATGLGGTTQKEYKIYQANQKGTKQLTVEFDSNVAPDLAWRFIPKQRRVTTKAGDNTLIFYESENLSNHDIVGTAVYNVSPAKAGKYFIKIHCFCFEEQLLKAGEKVLMPVSFVIDPDFENDPEMEDIDTITLSYSFFKVRDLKSAKGK